MKLKDIVAAACAFAIVAATPAFAAKTLIKDNALASYYGAQYHGRPTSSGELFDMYGMSAAHRTLPYGTMLEITNLENGNSVVVRVNDRGPFVDGREIDVSLGAAEKLGMIASGVARVSISILDDTEVSSRLPVPSSLTVASSNEQVAKPAQAAPVAQIAPAGSSDLPVQIAQAMLLDEEPTVAPATPIQPAPSSAPAPAATPAPAPLPILPALAPTPEPVEPEAAPPAEESPAPVAKTASTAAPFVASSPVWRFQLGAFMREENAIRLVRQIRAVGIEPSYERNGETIRVVIAGVNDGDVERVKSSLAEAGLYDYIIRREK